MTPNWLDKTEYPFKSNYFKVNKQNLHYIEEGTGETILFVHGTPSWSFDFRNVIKKLKDNYRCIAVDHMGFGLSDKPENYDYSTINHSQTLELFVKEKKLTNITLVVHDFGGPIGLNFAIKNPTLLKRIVILNSWLWSSEADPEFIKFKRILKSPLLPILYKYFNFSAKYLLPQSFGEHKISKQLLKQYTKVFSNTQERNGTIAFANSLLNDQSWFEELWSKRNFINEKPTLLIWGMKDKMIDAAYLEKFESGFTNSTTFRLNSCGHFPQEEQPGNVAIYIKDFIEKF